MPRIPATEIARIERETDLAALVRSRGVALHRQADGQLAGPCPFHPDDRASFRVHPEIGRFHCTACAAAGNAIRFVERFDGVSFRHAFELLQAGAAAFSRTPDTPLKQSTVPRLASPLDPAASDAELSERIADFYHERLLATPVALAYLRDLGLYHEEALRRFRLGLSDRTLGLRLPEANRVAGATIRARLQALGLYRANGREHLNGRIVLPLPDPAGCVGFYGRLWTKPNPGTPRDLYAPDPPVGLWNEDGVGPATDTAPAGELILCDDPFDALTLWVNGFRNVTFVPGTDGLTEDRLAAILSLRTRRIRLAYRADEAGHAATERDAGRFLAHGIEVFRVRLPWGRDINGHVLRETIKAGRSPDSDPPAARVLQRLLDAAEWVGAAPVPRAEASVHLTALADLPEQAAPDTPPALPRGPADLSIEEEDGYRVFHLGHREYRVGAPDASGSLDALKVSVRLRFGECIHWDCLDLSQDLQRRRFIERAAEETGLEKDLIKRDLGRLLLALESARDAREAAMLPAGPAKPAEQGVTLTDLERAEALALLRAPDLIERLGAAFDQCGLVGEPVNRIAAYLACTSRLLAKPLSVIVQSASAAGKSTLLETVLSMFPDEAKTRYSALTGQCLYYLGRTDLRHRILAVAEEQGAGKARYALKLLQSEGALSIASTGKNARSGRMETQEYRVEGPVAILLTTTAADVDEELLNRCLVLSADESREQTERILARQRRDRTLEGMRDRRRRPALHKLLRNAQRLLRPLSVINPWAEVLTFDAGPLRARRDHEKYLALIDAIALLHQHQRPIERDPEVASVVGTAGAATAAVEFIRVTLDDIALANRLAPALLGSAADDLSPQSRRALEAIREIVQEKAGILAPDCTPAAFSRREVRERLGWSATQVRLQLERLRKLEFIAAHQGGSGSAFQYVLASEVCRQFTPLSLGLRDLADLRGSIPTTPTCRNLTIQVVSGLIVHGKADTTNLTAWQTATHPAAPSVAS